MQALRVLWLWSGELDVRSILPCPADFPHLRTLYLKLVDKNTGWLSCLQHAPQLEQLQLMLQEQPAGPPPPAGSVVLPPMPKLAQLAIYCDTSSIGVRIPLDGLPALRELALDGGSPTLCADPSASSHHVQLTQLTAKVSGLRLEGARALSGLRHLTLDGKSILVDEALHTATALTRLELGSSCDGDHQPWMDPLLCSAWSLASLRALVLHGPLIPELAAELRGFSQLRALVVDGRSYIGLLLSAAHLWTNLEALSWDVIDGSPVIAVSQQGAALDPLQFLCHWLEHAAVHGGGAASCSQGGYRAQGGAGGCCCAGQIPEPHCVSNCARSPACRRCASSPASPGWTSPLGWLCSRSWSACTCC